MEQTFCYTARFRFDSNHVHWKGYLDFSKLYHVSEIVSLDASLNDLAFEIDRESGEYWRNVVATDSGSYTDLFKDLNFVKAKAKNSTYYNLLTVCIEPAEQCETIVFKDFDFLGYDLLDQYLCTSALTNCGGFDETFKPTELNRYGLIDRYERATIIRDNLYANNPDESHADCFVLALWRHKTIGR